VLVSVAIFVLVLLAAPRRGWLRSLLARHKPITAKK
jgi:hypothetical protein